MPIFFRGSLALVLVVAFGCDSSGGGDGAGGQGGEGTGGSPPPITCEAPADPQPFEVGTGEACFERLADDAPITQWSGPQGGYHLFLSVGCADCGDSVVVRSSVLDPQTGELVEGSYQNSVLAHLTEWDGWPQHAGVQVTMPGIQWDLENAPPLAEGTPILLSVQLLAVDESTVLHELDKPLTIGPTSSWDPCDLHPEGACCSEDCF